MTTFCCVIASRQSGPEAGYHVFVRLENVSGWHRACDLEWLRPSVLGGNPVGRFARVR